MCGIWAYFSKYECKNYQYSIVPKIRGPDSTTEITEDNFQLVFHRLAINDTSREANQPFVFTDPYGFTFYIMCNGEIYNYLDIIKKFEIVTKTRSDCEVLCYLFQKFWDNPTFISQEIDGEYSIVAMRETPMGRRSILAFRDPFGVRPLYWCYNESEVFFSSMLGGICKTPEAYTQHFPPGYYVQIDLEHINQNIPCLFYNVIKRYKKVSQDFNYLQEINKSLTNAVAKRITTTDREVGFFLSGGLDSSLVVAIASKLTKKPLRTFSIGMENSTDLIHARQVAKFLHTEHTEVLFTAQEAIDAIPEVIKCLETYDITTVRASTPSYLLAKHIRENTNIKVIMNGDGSDEVTCGYLYNYNAPTPMDAHNDALRLLKEIHKFDGLRCDRTIAGNSLEARVPFLDPQFVECYLSIPVELRVPTLERMEKLMLRDSFKGYLPESVLYRRKEAFSNGVSGGDQKESMITKIQDWAKSQGTTETLMYLKIFDDLFPNHQHILPHYWMPKWSGETTDPSATTLNIYKKLNL